MDHQCHTGHGVIYLIQLLWLRLSNFRLVLYTLNYPAVDIIFPFPAVLCLGLESVCQFMHRASWGAAYHNNIIWILSRGFFSYLHSSDIATCVVSVKYSSLYMLFNFLKIPFVLDCSSITISWGSLYIQRILKFTFANLVHFVQYISWYLVNTKKSLWSYLFQSWTMMCTKENLTHPDTDMVYRKTSFHKISIFLLYPWCQSLQLQISF